jgi:hypothetical protein
MKRSTRALVGMTVVLAVVCGMAAANGAEPGIVIAGGALDPHFPGAETYVTEPTSARVPPGKACVAAQSYVYFINAGQLQEIAGLFGDDAVILDPMRQTVRGIAAVRAFYAAKISALKPQLIAVAYLGDDQDCMVELASGRELQGRLRYTLVSIDHFTLGRDGRIAWMVAFARPPRQE